MEWTEYELDGNDYVPMERWGKDHWSTFLYLETCAVDNSGKIDRLKMRCNPRLHRELANVHPSIGLMDGSKYPTRLQDGELDKHDDWSCLEDMVAEGLIKAWCRVARPRDAFGNSEAKVELTELGWWFVGQLRCHRASGGRFVNFSPEYP